MFWPFECSVTLVGGFDPVSGFRKYSVRLERFPEIVERLAGIQADTLSRTRQNVQPQRSSMRWRRAS